ncbi:McrC family protein [Actinomadura rubrobrunea]|uniref:McrC family protein n=1 Tax=Actinomadura rubrobrunea TaxID=115335 RepID=UPI001C3F287F|nr:McrC family protein [Actinomadura rubrobrunea]
MAASEVVRIAPGPRTGLWRVRDNRLVGAARIGPAHDPVEVRIAPKTPIDRLFFLLGYAHKQRGWRQEDVDAGEHPDLLPALAYAFARAAERALRQGVLLGYRETEEALTVVRGRIRETDQIRRRHGQIVPVEVRYDDYTVDIPENRLLLSATYRLLRLPGIPAGTRRLLRHLLVRLDGVERIVPGRALPQWTPTRLNARYHTALGLAELVLRGASYELDDGRTLRVDGLLLEMWRVFEDFLTVALSDALRPYGGRSEMQDRRHHLDHDRNVPLRPDLVYYDAGGEPVAVVDAKYKIEGRPGEHEADLYQMLAYCTVMGLRSGHLVYAAGDAESWVHRIVGTGGVRIVEAVVDVSLPPDALLAQVADLARQIAVDTERAGVTA